MLCNFQCFSELQRAHSNRVARREHSTGRERLWKLLRDLKAIEEGIESELDITDALTVFNEWYGPSYPFLDAKTRDDYPTEFFAGFSKVRVPGGKGDTSFRNKRTGPQREPNVTFSHMYARTPDAKGNLKLERIQKGGYLRFLKVTQRVERVSRSRGLASMSLNGVIVGK